MVGQEWALTERLSIEDGDAFFRSHRPSLASTRSHDAPRLACRTRRDACTACVVNE